MIFLSIENLILIKIKLTIIDNNNIYFKNLIGFLQYAQHTLFTKVYTYFNIFFMY